MSSHQIKREKKTEYYHFVTDAGHTSHITFTKLTKYRKDILWDQLDSPGDNKVFPNFLITVLYDLSITNTILLNIL